MNCPKCEHDKYDTDAMMLVMGQEGAEEKMLVVHTCQACGHKWRGKA
jgi:DNA-directed RNA polymerase subunit M/transcription elongation factor TFIIS